MDKFPKPENRESRVDRLIDDLANREGMNPEDILSDIITFGSSEDTEASNPDYIDEVAERLGISSEELKAYAIKKAKDNE